mgnify:CR=1 FL=1
MSTTAGSLPKLADPVADSVVKSAADFGFMPSVHGANRPEYMRFWWLVCHCRCDRCENAMYVNIRSVCRLFFCGRFIACERHLAAVTMPAS